MLRLQVADQPERRDEALDVASRPEGELLERLSPRASPRACLRLRGGGGDGGATGAESRSSYLEMYKTQKPGEVRALLLRTAGPVSPARSYSYQLDAREEQLAVWTCCRLTRQQLGGEDGKAAVVRGCTLLPKRA